MEEAGEAPDPGADDPEEVVDGTEEVTADQEEARHVHVEEKSWERDGFLTKMMLGLFNLIQMMWICE